MSKYNKGNPRLAHLMPLKKAPKYRYVAWVLMVFPYIMFYAAMQMINSLGPEIMEQVGIAEGKLGALSSVQSVTMAIASVLTGALCTKFGGKKIITVGLVVMAGSGLLYMSNPDSYTLLLIFRLVQGFGTGMVSASLMGLVNAWFPANERGFGQALLSCTYGLSITVSTLFAFQCTSAGMTWNKTMGSFLLYGGLVLAAAIVLFYKDIQKEYGVDIIDEAMEGYEPEKSAAVDIGAQKLGSNIKRPRNWSEALRFPGFWLVGWSCFFFAWTCFGITFTFPMFLTEIGYSADASTSITSIGTLASIIFALIGGPIISDRLFKARRCECNLISFGGAGILFLLYAFLCKGEASVTVMTVLFFIAYGILYITSGPGWCLPTEIVAPEFAAQNMGTCLLFSGMGGFVGVWLMGIVAESAGAQMALLTTCAGMFCQCIFSFLVMRKYHA